MIRRRENQDLSFCANKHKQEGMKEIYKSGLVVDRQSPLFISGKS